MSQHHDKVVGLSETALAKIDDLREQMKPGSIQAIPSGAGFPLDHTTGNSDATVYHPLMKYVWLGEEDTATVEWLNHMIAEFTDRRDRIIEHGGGEIFREYLQQVSYSENGSQYYLGMKHGPDNGALSDSKIKEYEWSVNDIGKVR